MNEKKLKNSLTLVTFRSCRDIPSWISSFSLISWGYFIRALFLNSVSHSRGLITVTAFVWLLFWNIFFIWTMDTFHTYTYTITQKSTHERWEQIPIFIIRGKIIVVYRELGWEWEKEREKERRKCRRECMHENVAFVIMFEQSKTRYENETENANENEKRIYLIRLKSFCLYSSSTPSISFRPLFSFEQWKRTYYYSTEYPDFYLTL